MNYKESIDLIAHGGFPARYPENSLDGILAAAEYDPLAIEMDVVIDPNLNQLVCFHPEGVSSDKGTYSAETVESQLKIYPSPSVVEIMKQVPHTVFLLDFKQPSEQAFQSLVLTNEIDLSRVIVGVRDIDYFSLLKELNPGIETLALFSNPEGYSKYAASGGKYYRLWQKDVSQELVKQLHLANLEVWVTPGHKATETQSRTAGEIDQETLNWLISISVDAVLVNDIAKVKQYI